MDPIFFNSIDLGRPMKEILKNRRFFFVEKVISLLKLTLKRIKHKISRGIYSKVLNQYHQTNLTELRFRKIRELKRESQN